MSNHFTIIELSKEQMKFSASHFTIFSSTERERIHGHNYHTHLSLKVQLNHQGINFNYAIYKKQMVSLCNQLDEYLLLPGLSPFLSHTIKGSNIEIHFNQEYFSLPKNDVLILPLKNITLEELSKWFITQLINDQKTLTAHQIFEMNVKVYSAKGQSCSHSWQNPNL